MNGVNIGQFQFEYDLTWMSFFLSGEGKTYTRYGGREDTEAESHLNKASLVSVMNQVLELHKTGGVKEFSQFEPSGETVAIPDDLASMKKIQAKRDNKCIHCHEVKAAKLTELRDEGKLTKDMVFTYPSPRNLGLELDSKVQSKIFEVARRSPAQKAGLKQGDVLQQLNGQRILTFADATRVLELAEDTGNLAVVLERKGKRVETEIKLAKGWRSALSDPSWRESTHVVGPNSGFWAVELSKTERSRARITNQKLGLRVNVIWGAWAKQAKLKRGDVVLAIDGQTNAMGIKQLQTYLQMKKEWGDTVEIVVLRKGKRVSLKMKLPDGPDH